MMIIFNASVLFCGNENLVCFQVSPWDKREEANEKKLAFALANSDHLALLQAYKVPTALTIQRCSFYSLHQYFLLMHSLSLAGMVHRCKVWPPCWLPLLQGELSVMAWAAGEAALSKAVSGFLHLGNSDG